MKLIRDKLGKEPEKPHSSQVSRRDVIIGLSAATAGVAGKMLMDKGLNEVTFQQDSGIDKDIVGSLALNGDVKIPFYGVHQAGIATAAPAFVLFLGLNLKPVVNKIDLTRLMKLLTDDAVRLTQGVPPLADTEPELSRSPAKLTITVGFGPNLFSKVGLHNKQPAWLEPLPAFKIDKLDPRWGQTDLVIQVCSDDPVTLSHTKKILVKDAEYYTNLKWIQEGFRRSFGTEAKNSTMRNLLGQITGTANPPPTSNDFSKIVWAKENNWFKNGTSLVLRRIALDTTAWEQLDRPAKEQVIGRKLRSGAPLTGKTEFDLPDFNGNDTLGAKIIAPEAHIRRAHSPNPQERIFRRNYNYDLNNVSVGKQGDVGMLFASYQADIKKQFLPIQQRLAQADALNRWTTPIGSAVFVMLPGCNSDGYLGETLLEA